MPESLSSLLLPVSLVSIAMLGWWIVNFNRYLSYRKLLQHGAGVQGVITLRETHTKMLGVAVRAKYPKFQYRFLTGMGTEFFSAKKTIPLLMGSREEQDLIGILYLPENPEVNHMAEDIRLHLRALYLWLFVPLVCWLFVISPLVVFWLLAQGTQ